MQEPGKGLFGGERGWGWGRVGGPEVESLQAGAIQA